MKFYLALFAVFSIQYVNASVYERELLWNKSEVVVCFYDDESQVQLTEERMGENAKYILLPFTNSQKVFTKKLINANYTKEETGISFIGWKNCSELSNFDVILFRIEPKKNELLDFSGKSSIGVGGIKYEKELIPNGYEKSRILIYRFRSSTLLHEFGHIAGFRHEHIRIESKRDPNCFTYAQANYSRGLNHNGRNLWYRQFVKLSKGLDVLYRSSQFGSFYDPNSIMNYCHNYKQNLNMQKSQLSEIDKKTLRSLYN